MRSSHFPTDGPGLLYVKGLPAGTDLHDFTGAAEKEFCAAGTISDAGACLIHCLRPGWSYSFQ